MHMRLASSFLSSHDDQYSQTPSLEAVCCPKQLIHAGRDLPIRSRTATRPLHPPTQCNLMSETNHQYLSEHVVTMKAHHRSSVKKYGSIS